MFHRWIYQHVDFLPCLGGPNGFDLDDVAVRVLYSLHVPRRPSFCSCGHRNLFNQNCMVSQTNCRGKIWKSQMLKAESCGQVVHESDKVSSNSFTACSQNNNGSARYRAITFTSLIPTSEVVLWREIISLLA